MTPEEAKKIKAHLYYLRKKQEDPEWVTRRRNEQLARWEAIKADPERHAEYLAQHGERRRQKAAGVVE